MTFGQIKWPKEESSPEKIKNERLAWYECFYCKKHIDDNQKSKMMLNGEWIPDKKEPNKNRGFWISSLYSPWLTWSDIAAEFLRSKDYIELLMNFVNSWLAEVWEEKIEETTVDRVRSLSRDYDEGLVPDDVLVLTAGVDVQKDHFYFVIRGHREFIYRLKINELIKKSLIRDANIITSILEKSETKPKEVEQCAQSS